MLTACYVLIVIGTLAGFIAGSLLTHHLDNQRAKTLGDIADVQNQGIQDRDRMISQFASRLVAGPNLHAVALTEELLNHPPTPEEEKTPL